MSILASDFWSFMEQLATTLGVVAVAMVPVVLLLVRNHKQGQRVEEQNERIYQHINNIEEGEAVDGQPVARPPTLGSVLRSVERRVEAGFKENDAVHDKLAARVEGIEATIRRLLRIENGGHQ